jgi:uncharacterized protein (TIGR03084 family)
VIDLDALVDDLEAEQRVIAEYVRELDADGWLTPTPSWQWDVRDTVSHLAHTDEVAIDTMTDGPNALMEVSGALASSEDVTYLGVLRGRRRSGPEVLTWWEERAAREREHLRALAPSTRVAWGLGMGAPAFVTARLMETWAHGLDIAAALRIEVHDTDRLANIAWLATRALPYAYSVAGRPPPDAAIRVELTLPSGARWSTGPEDAANRISGPAGEYCRVFVQRLPQVKAVGIHAEGDAAVDALTVARAYL